MGLALLVWVGGSLLKRVSNFFGNEPSLGRKSNSALASAASPLVQNLKISLHNLEM